MPSAQQAVAFVQKYCRSRRPCLTKQARAGRLPASMWIVQSKPGNESSVLFWPSGPGNPPRPVMASVLAEVGGTDPTKRFFSVSMVLKTRDATRLQSPPARSRYRSICPRQTETGSTQRTSPVRRVRPILSRCSSRGIANFLDVSRAARAWPVVNSIGGGKAASSLS